MATHVGPRGHEKRIKPACALPLYRMMDEDASDSDSGSTEYHHAFSMDSERDALSEDSKVTDEDITLFPPSPKRRKMSDPMVSGKPFPEDVKRKLESLYYAGMNGWGRKHQSELDTAMATTGLSLEQVKVWCKFPAW